MSDWTERPQDITDRPEGDIGGDIQRSDAWGRRFVRQRSDGTWDVCTVAFYTATDTPGLGAEPATRIVEQEEIVNCTDPDDPGGTELDSDYWYDEVPGSREGPLTNDEMTIERVAGHYAF
jgi:hypothetical protein